MLHLILGLTVLGAQPRESAFNSYAVFLSPTKAPGGCSVADPESFRNRTYRFRGHIYPFGMPLTLRAGKVVERNPLGTAEWETSLEEPKVVKVGERSAVLLVFSAEHVNGTGSATHVLVAGCGEGHLDVMFEAGGEGVRDVFFSSDQGITLTRLVWSSTDAHCCPSGEAEERYMWTDASGRFMRHSRAKRAAAK